MNLITKQRICPICEAGCGLTITAKGREVISIQANKQDVFSRGHMCPKGVSLQDLDADPDRIRTPLINKGGKHVEATWQEAFELIKDRLGAIKAAFGPNAVASYIGNPTAHNIGLSKGLGIFSVGLGSKNIFSAGSVDQIPKQLASEFMFGDGMAIPVPDIERCDYLLMLGANPVVSNGSLWMVPKIREKLRALRKRGGLFVTVDPRKSETAKMADHHHFIRPGTDAWLLAAIINELLALGASFEDRYPTKNQKALLVQLHSIQIEEAAHRTGISVESIREIAAQLFSAKHSAVYGRVGTTLQAFGTLTSYLIEVVNILTCSLDAEGGAMFPEQPYCAPRAASSGEKYNRYQSRVSGYPEVFGLMPAACLIEEIETQGDDQIRALVTFAGNVVVSNPDSVRLEAALNSLDFIVSIDIYHNETTKLADVILPGTSPFEDSHYDEFLGAMGYRNTARYSPPVFASDRMDEWDVALSLGYIVSNSKVATAQELAEFEDNVVAAAAASYARDATSPLHSRDVQELVAMIEPERGVERLLDLGIRAGRWGDHFGAREGLTLQKLIDTPNGIDLGAPRSRLAEVIRTRDGKIDLGHDLIIDEFARLRVTPVTEDLMLIGRRSVQTNNTWLHNLPSLTKGSLANGKQLCTLDLNPGDARLHGLKTGDWAELRSSTGAVKVQVKLSQLIAPGVVSLPHGFSEDTAMQQGNRRSQRGANYNALASVGFVDVVSATSALNGIPVTIKRLE
jgi:anaerobic selenocysteine-containing dehydrogenase